MRNRTEILEDVRKHPEVDAFRYEYADAFEAKDEVYASYIRERVKWTSYPKGQRPLTSRSEDLEARIAAPLLRYCYDVTFDRGFVNEITIDPFVFIDRGHELLDQAPIEKVIFSPKPVPPGVEVPLVYSVVPSPVPELMACPLLGRLSAIAFTMTRYQRWATNAADLEAVLASPHLSRMLLLTLPEWFWTTFTEQQSHEYWARALSRADFRKMLTLELPGDPGEGIRKFDEGDFGIQEVTPMPEEGRAFEREHGYLPCLHLAEKWGTSQLGLLHDNEIILAAQRGELPRFPVGAPVTAEMYAPPPRKQSQNLFHW